MKARKFQVMYQMDDESMVHMLHFTAFTRQEALDQFYKYLDKIAEANGKPTQDPISVIATLAHVASDKVS